MASSRKQQMLIDRTIKRIEEGHDQFNEFWAKMDALPATLLTQRDKLAAEMKKELKKLQRLREQVRAWHIDAGPDLQAVLDHARGLVEEHMERYRAYERAAKVRAFSAAGLEKEERQPEEVEKEACREWLAEVLDSLNRSVETMSADIEDASEEREDNKPDSEHKEAITLLETHVVKLEQSLRALENDLVCPDQLNEIREGLEYLADSGIHDSQMLQDMSIYDELCLDAVDQNVGRLILHRAGANTAASAADASPPPNSLLTTPAATESQTPSTKPFSAASRNGKRSKSTPLDLSGGIVIGGTRRARSGFAHGGTKPEPAPAAAAAATPPPPPAPPSVSQSTQLGSASTATSTAPSASVTPAGSVPRRQHTPAASEQSSTDFLTAQSVKLASDSGPSLSGHTGSRTGSANKRSSASGELGRAKSNAGSIAALQSPRTPALLPGSRAAQAAASERSVNGPLADGAIGAVVSCSRTQYPPGCAPPDAELLLPDTLTTSDTGVPVRRSLTASNADDLRSDSPLARAASSPKLPATSGSSPQLPVSTCLRSPSFDSDRPATVHAPPTPQNLGFHPRPPADRPDLRRMESSPCMGVPHPPLRAPPPHPPPPRRSTSSAFPSPPTLPGSSPESSALRNLWSPSASPRPSNVTTPSAAPPPAPHTTPTTQILSGSGSGSADAHAAARKLWLQNRGGETLEPLLPSPNASPRLPPGLLAAPPPPPTETTFRQTTDAAADVASCDQDTKSLNHPPGLVNGSAVAASDGCLEAPARQLSPVTADKLMSRDDVTDFWNALDEPSHDAVRRLCVTSAHGSESGMIPSRDGALLPWGAWRDTRERQCHLDILQRPFEELRSDSLFKDWDGPTPHKSANSDTARSPARAPSPQVSTPTRTPTPTPAPSSDASTHPSAATTPPSSVGSLGSPPTTQQGALRRPSSYPTKPVLRLFDDDNFARVPQDDAQSTLFAAFYYSAGHDMAQKQAADRLMAQNWRYHKGYQTWFKRLRQPVEIDDHGECGHVAFFNHIVPGHLHPVVTAEGIDNVEVTVSLSPQDSDTASNGAQGNEEQPTKTAKAKVGVSPSTDKEEQSGSERTLPGWTPMQLRRFRFDYKHLEMDQC